MLSDMLWPNLSTAAYLATVDGTPTTSLKNCCFVQYSTIEMCSVWRPDVIAGDYSGRISYLENILHWRRVCPEHQLGYIRDACFVLASTKD